MKKISKILKQALKKSAVNLVEERLLVEQGGPVMVGSYGLQITNVTSPYGSGTGFRCHSPVLRQCNINVDGTPNTNQECRVYPFGCIMRTDFNVYDPTQPYDQNTNNPDSLLYQIGDCFSWAFGSPNQNKIECIIGFAGLHPTDLRRTERQCPECTTDVHPNIPGQQGNGIFDCVDCQSMPWSGQIPGCLACPTCTNYGGPGSTYNPVVTVDNGTCEGCTNPQDPFYNPGAVIDDGSCQQVNDGCTDPSADNYISWAQSDDGSCEWTKCVDSVASNYFFANGTPSVLPLPAAASSTGTPWTSPMGVTGTAKHNDDCYYWGCADPAANNYSYNGNPYPAVPYGPTNSPAPTAHNDPYGYGAAKSPNNEFCEYDPGCSDPQASNADPGAVNACAGITPPCPSDDGSCTYAGCTDPNALNYSFGGNPYPVSVQPGNNPVQADGDPYDPAPVVGQGNGGFAQDDGSCFYETFDCIEGNCESNLDGGGAYPDLATCIASDECGRFRCQKNFDDDIAPDPNLTPQSFPNATSTECVPCDQSYYDFTNKQWNPQCKTLEACESDPDCTYRCSCCDGISGVSMQSQGVGGLGTYGPAGCAQYNGGQFSNCAPSNTFNQQDCIDSLTCDDLPTLLQGTGGNIQLPGFSQPQLIQDAYDLGLTNNQAYGVLDGNSLFCLEVCGMFQGNPYGANTQYPCDCCGPRHCDDAHLGGGTAVVPGCFTCGSFNPSLAGSCHQIMNWQPVSAFSPGALFYSTAADCQANVLNDPGCKAGTPDDPIIEPDMPDMPEIPVAEPVDPINPPILDEPDIQEPIQEGVQIKGKLLNSSRMARLAGIKRKK